MVIGRATANIAVRGAIILALAAIVLWAAPTARVAAAATETVRLTVEGMVCPLCERTVESVGDELNGVVAVDADRRSESATVTYDPTQVDADAIAAHFDAQTPYRVSIGATAPVAGAQTHPAARDTPSSDGTPVAVTAAIAVAVLGAVAAWRFRRRSRTTDLSE